ncbi:MAG: hypothetical protein IKL71_06665 [Bacteroidaceae bacterium]|nr:hypothetical protein [Bacteroidaceae bacterium]
MSEWKKYVQSLTDKYGKATNLIWISKKRRKFILEFAYARILIINDNLYKFADITSCRIEQVPSTDNVLEETDTNPHVLLIGTNRKTEMLMSITVSGKQTAHRINNLLQEIIKSNKLFHE